MVTAGWWVFTSAAMDLYFRAFDSESGKEVWKYKLPAGGQATPMTYRRRQAVRCDCRGRTRELHTKQGDYVMAFTAVNPFMPGTGRSL